MLFQLTNASLNKKWNPVSGLIVEISLFMLTLISFSPVHSPCLTPFPAPLFPCMCHCFPLSAMSPLHCVLTSVPPPNTNTLRVSVETGITNCYSSFCSWAVVPTFRRCMLHPASGVDPEFGSADAGGGECKCLCPVWVSRTGWQRRVTKRRSAFEGPKMGRFR